MEWFYFACSSIIFFTSVDLLQRILATNSKNHRAMAFLFNSFATFFALIMFLVRNGVSDFSLSAPREAWLFVAIASLMYAGFERYRFKAAKLLDASIFATVLNVSVVVAFVGSVFLYKEPLGLTKIIGSLLILVALILVSFGRKSKKHLSGKGLILGISISTILGLGWMLDKKGTLYFGSDIYNILLWGIPVFFIYFPYISYKDLAAEFRLGNWKILLLSALNVVGYYLQLRALEIGEATKVIPIVQTTTLFTVLFGILLLKERDNVGKKIIAAILALTGVYLLV